MYTPLSLSPTATLAATQVLASFYLIVMQMDNVYDVSMPPLVRRFLSPLSFTFSFGFLHVDAVLECRTRVAMLPNLRFTW